jgi:hypothetical protein
MCEGLNLNFVAYFSIEDTGTYVFLNQQRDTGPDSATDFSIILGP